MTHVTLISTCNLKKCYNYLCTPEYSLNDRWWWALGMTCICCSKSMPKNDWFRVRCQWQRLNLSKTVQFLCLLSPVIWTISNLNLSQYYFDKMFMSRVVCNRNLYSHCYPEKLLLDCQYLILYYPLNILTIMFFGRLKTKPYLQLQATKLLDN